MRGKVSMALILIFMFSAMHGTSFITSVVADSKNDSAEMVVSLNNTDLRRNWSFNSPEMWGDFACIDNDSAEIVIGINGARSDAYTKLMSLITKSNGRLINTVSFKTKLGAVVADIPFEAVSFFIKEIRATSSLVRYVEPNMKFSVTLTPNDPNWTVQWGPKKIEADWAWNTTTGNSSILVAVIDTGIDYNHTDLAANYVPLGYDWVNNSANPRDDHGHGTHCAGVIAAEINNGVGIAGLAQVRIMAEKGLDSAGYGSWDDLANAIIHAVDQGADILSNSWGGYGYSSLVHDAVKYAYNHSVLVVAAAGNEASRAKLYPAAYDEVIAVTATDESDDPAWFTSYGYWVELAAPGVNIYSTMPTYHVTMNDPPRNKTQNYCNMSGTSMACPHVAGVAALIWSQYPNMTRDWVRLQLRRTADDLGSEGFDIYYGYGRVNARKAVEQAPPDHDLLMLDLEIPWYLDPGNSTVINSTVFNFGKNDESNITVQLLVNGTIVNSTDISFLASGASKSVNFSWTPTEEALYNITSYAVRQGSQAETLWVDAFDETWTAWSETPPPPYLDSEGSGNIATTSKNVQEGWFTFEDHGGNGTITAVTLKIYAKGRVGPNPVLRTYLHDGTTENDLGTKYVTSYGYTYYDYDVSSYLDSWTKIDNAKIRLKSEAGIPPPPLYVDAAKLEVSYKYPLGEENMENNALSKYRRAGGGRTIMVPEDYPTIQEAIDASFPRDIIWVYKGHNVSYYEHIEIYKPYIKLVGKELGTTIIDGNGTGTVVLIIEDNVDITGFTIRNGTLGIDVMGKKCNITRNIVTENFDGIHIMGSSGNIINNNTVTSHGGTGIVFAWGGGNNTCSNNTVTSNYEIGICITLFSEKNVISYNKVTSSYKWGAIVMTATSRNIVRGNTVTKSHYGIHIKACGLNTLRDNNMTENDYSLGIESPPPGGWVTIHDARLSFFIQDIDTSNTVDGKPVYYLINQSNVVIDYSTFSDVGFLGLINSTNITVMGLNLTKNGEGVLFAYVTNSTIKNVNASSNYVGIALIRSRGNVISGNTLSNNIHGLEIVYESRNNTISGNTITLSNQYGIFLRSSNSNTVSANNLLNNSIGDIYLANVLLADSSNNTIRGNIIALSNYAGIDLLGSNSNYISDNNVTFNNEFGIRIGNSRNNAIIGNNLSSNGMGICLGGSNNNNISGNDVTSNNYDGIYLGGSSNNSVSGNDVTSNNYGIYLDGVSNNSFSGNDVTSNNWAGIYLKGSTSNVIVDNTLTNNEYGLYLDWSSNSSIRGNNVTNNHYGIFLTWSCHSNRIGQYVPEEDDIIGNQVKNNTVGIYLYASNNNSVTANNMENNDIGMKMESASDNKIYHNNFINNTVQVYNTTCVLSNRWTDRWDCEGNYWSDYEGGDTSGDGIGDTLLPAPDGNPSEEARVDYKPLMAPYVPGDINHDGHINGGDGALLGVAWGSEPGDPNWNPHADLNEDAIIDEKDQEILSKHWYKGAYD